MSKLDYKISERYDCELLEINYTLDKMERGKIYGKIYDLTHVPMDGYLKTNIKQLRSMINDLLDKIQNDGKSQGEKERELMEKIKLYD